MKLLMAVLTAGTAWAQVNQWKNVGPEAAGAGFLVFDPVDPSAIYAGTAVGLFKSNDGGASWSNAGLIGWSVISLVIDPQNPSSLYAATLWDPGNGVTTNQVYKSADGGATWNEADSGLPAQSIKLLPIARQKSTRREHGRRRASAGPAEAHWVVCRRSWRALCD